MIIIDKAKAQQNIILTLTELTTIESVAYLMVLKNDALSSVFRILLPENTSPAPQRYDLFRLDTYNFYELPLGFYSYAVYQQEQGSAIKDESSLGIPIEVGKLYIKPIEVEALEVSADSHNYLIYNLN